MSGNAYLIDGAVRYDMDRHEARPNESKLRGFKDNRALLDDPETMAAMTEEAKPEPDLGNPPKCASCGADMDFAIGDWLQYDSWVCPNAGCDCEIELETRTGPETLRGK